jgi:hypothetical protein
VNRIVVLFALMVGLVGCGTINTVEHKKGLVPSTKADVIEIASDMTYVESRGLGNRWEEGLRKGTYKPEFENQLGTFYRGAGKPVMQRMGDAKFAEFEGGIWVPKNGSGEKYRIFFVFDYDPAIAQGAVIAGILASFKGDITFMPEIRDEKFLSQLKVVPR